MWEILIFVLTDSGVYYFYYFNNMDEAGAGPCRVTREIRVLYPALGQVKLLIMMMTITLFESKAAYYYI